MSDPVRIGILGAGAVAKYALIAPARRDNGIVVASVAARDANRAAAYAAANGIPRASTYDEMLADPEIEAVYVATPNSLHCEWTLKALDAGKAVLCEKPLGSNAAEARRMADAPGLLVEALHWRYHPQSDRMRQLIEGGAIGALTEIDFTFLVPGKYFQPDDIRFRRDLSGGAVMDLGYYAISFLRFVAGAEPEAILRAEAVQIAPDVDGAMKAEMRFPGGCIARMNLSLVDKADDFTIAAEITGERGSISIVNPVHPQNGGGLDVIVEGAARNYPPEKPATYDWQARAFARNVREDAPVLTTAREGAAIMQVIDDVYRAAGMNPRGV